MFYNTINLSGADLLAANVQANSQEETIKAIFKVNPGKQFSPSQILNIVETHYKLKWPLTSIRRAITNLTKDNALTKLSTMIMGIYGVPEHCWKYKVIVKQSQLF